MATIAQTVYNQDVYEPSDDTFALVDAITADKSFWLEREPSIIVELGCGSGFVMCSCALLLCEHKHAAYKLAIDVSQAAVTATQATLTAHAVHDVDIVCADKFGPVEARLKHAVDLVLFNPPYVVTPHKEVLQGGIAAAWAGGRDGRVVIDAVLARIDSLLSDNGCMYMIAIADNNPADILNIVHAQYGLHGSTVLTRRADEELISVLRFSRQPKPMN